MGFAILDSDIIICSHDEVHTWMMFTDVHASILPSNQLPVLSTPPVYHGTKLCHLFPSVSSYTCSECCCLFDCSNDPYKVSLPQVCSFPSIFHTLVRWTFKMKKKKKSFLLRSFFKNVSGFSLNFFKFLR